MTCARHCRYHPPIHQVYVLTLYACGLIMGRPFPHNRHLHRIGCNPTEPSKVGLSSSLPSSSLMVTCILSSHFTTTVNHAVIDAVIKIVHSYAHGVVIAIFLFCVFCTSLMMSLTVKAFRRTRGTHMQVCRKVRGQVGTAMLGT